MEKIIINNNIIKQLITGYKSVVIDKTKYDFIGKGGDGVIYESNGKIIKIYTKNDIDSVMKEFYVVGMLQELSPVNNNVISVDKYYLSLSYPVMVMELMDGDLNNLGNELIKNPNNLDNQTYDMTWASMIFQVCYGIYYLNSLGILHNDAKPKNILYKKPSINHIKYSINHKIYNVPIYYLFKIADFGAIQIMGSSLNKMSDDEIKDKINNKYDYYELSKLINRILVNYAIKVYNIASLDKLFHDDKDYNKYKKEEISKVEENTYLRNIPNKQQFILRGLLYYLIETKKLDLTNTIEKNNIKLPSKKIMDLFDNINNPKIDFFELFDKIF